MTSPRETQYFFLMVHPAAGAKGLKASILQTVEETANLLLLGCSIQERFRLRLSSAASLTEVQLN